MKILWISSLAWKKDDYLFEVDGPGAVSGSLFQQSMIEGLERLGAEVDLISDYPYKSAAIRRKAMQYSHRSGAKDHILPTESIPYINHVIKGCRIKKAVTEFAKRESYDCVIAYLVHTPYLQGLKAGRDIRRGTKSVLICPDLPGMMDMSLDEKPIKRFLKAIDGRIINRLQSSVDGYVLFTEHMAEKIPVGGKPSIVIEGIASVDELDITPMPKEKAIMHAGTLHKNIGIENIVKAMRHIDDPGLALWFFGDGELRPSIIQASQKDERIQYKGFVGRDELFAYEKKAIALVNARNPRDAFTRYSFPSKTFEYLYSGTPYITTKLEGTPKEYSEHFYEIEDNEPETIAAAVNQILQRSEAENIVRADKAREFVGGMKNASIQAAYLLEFMERLVSKT